MKKILSVMLTIVMVLSLIPMAELAKIDLSGLFIRANAEEIVASGKCGNNVLWTLNDKGVLIISGTGDMYNWTSYQYNPQWYSLREQIKTVEIDFGVTSIGAYSFSDCYCIKTVSVPDSVTFIGRSAFFECTSLISLSLPNGITDILYETFFN